MDYKVKYEQAIADARAIIKDYKERHLDNIAKRSEEDFSAVFPELKESEDERIRKKLIEAVKGDMVVGGAKDKQLAIAWLEKQGEKKPLKVDFHDLLMDVKFGIDPSPKQGEKKHQYKSRPRYVGEEELLGANEKGEQKPVDVKPHLPDGNIPYDRGFEEAQEEPVSEELEEASKEWLRPQLDKSYEKYGENKMMELTRFDAFAMLEAIEFGAKWKEEQFEKNRLKHCNSISNEQAELEQKFLDEHLDKYDRMPTFLDAIEYGMRLQKEQMMAKAIDADCFGFQGAALFSFRLPSDKYLVGSKVKVIVIKED